MARRIERQGGNLPGILRRGDFVTSQGHMTCRGDFVTSRGHMTRRGDFVTSHGHMTDFVTSHGHMTCFIAAVLPRDQRCSVNTHLCDHRCVGTSWRRLVRGLTNWASISTVRYGDGSSSLLCHATRIIFPWLCTTTNLYFRQQRRGN